MRLFAGKPRGQGDKGWLERFVKARAEEIGLVRSEMPAQDFLQYCIDAAPVSSGRRDIRRQSFVRAMRRMQERGDLPFEVRGEVFVFE